ncbi:MAG: HAD-IIIC family phosphatase [Fermentimonas sp.]|nr:HAD-IIIC family phosphatase [Fermentimonas sp.]
MISNFSTLQKNLKKDTSLMPTIKAALLGDTATQFLATALKGTAIERGFNIDLFEADYNQVERQLLDPDSDLYTFDPEYIIVFQSTHKLLSAFNNLPPEQQHTLADERIEFVKTIAAMVKSRLIYFNYPEIDDTVFGNYANKTERSFTYQVRKLNLMLMECSVANTNLFINDIASIQNKMGRDAMFHPAVYIGSEMVLSLDAIPYVTASALDVISALHGKFKKCLILDLDNTLWGGVVGDDGYEKLELGHELGIGKAFTEFQQWVLKLKNRGIIIAVCSKNNEETAKEPFLKHPEMVLKLDDIAVFIANWENKADNIRRIQSILNIGYDSMVFLDDNPFERNIVRENLPEVMVPELPEDPAEYLEYLYSLNLFETAAFSNADAERTRQYQVDAERVATQINFTNEADFLKSLNMKSEVRPFNSFNTPRVSQLSQRSNQFNLRTIRYTVADIEKLSRDPRFQNFSFTLTDKFGDNGLICVVILEKKDKKTLFIDTWLMSCRILKRGMEHFTLNTIVDYAKRDGFENIVGEYIPTAKNSMVQDHYSRLGFVPSNENGRHLFVLDVADYQKKECYITTV